MDILQGQAQINRKALEILNYYGCTKASSIHNNSTFLKFLRSKVTFSERSNIALSRMRKNITNSTRNALLVVLVLILTATYQSAVNPPYELAQAYLRQGFGDLFNSNPNSFPSQLNNIDANPSPFPFSVPDSNEFPYNNNDPPPSPDNLLNDLNKFVGVKIDPVALSFSIFNAVDFMVTLLVTLFILPWVPQGQLLHVLLLLVFIFFVVSMGLSFALTTWNIGVAVFCFFVVILIILAVFFVRNKVRYRKVYRECIKEFGDRVRLQKQKHDDGKKK